METETQRVKAWDVPTRLFHWTLVVLILLQWGTGEGMLPFDWHFYLGYATLTLILFRIVWGLIGARTARFTDFVQPAAAPGYLGRFISGPAPKYLGHNPLGGLVVVAFIVLIGAIAITGLFSADEEDFVYAPLSHLVSTSTAEAINEVHEQLWHILIPLILLHIAAVLLYLFWKGENLIQPMVSGIKVWRGAAVEPVRERPIAAILALAACSAAVAALVTLI